MKSARPVFSAWSATTTKSNGLLKTLFPSSLDVPVVGLEELIQSGLARLAKPVEGESRVGL